jgi:ferredoxin
MAVPGTACLPSRRRGVRDAVEVQVSFRISPACDGCGTCVRACPRGAIRRSPGGDAPYEVVSLDCNDCGKCAVVCPRDALGPDNGWAECLGRGCPLTGSRRYEGWACNEGIRRCAECGNALWKPPGAVRWMCVRCDGGARVLCPKVRKAHAGGDGRPPWSG